MLVIIILFVNTFIVTVAQLTVEYCPMTQLCTLSTPGEMSLTGEAPHDLMHG